MTVIALSDIQDGGAQMRVEMKPMSCVSTPTTWRPARPSRPWWSTTTDA